MEKSRDRERLKMRVGEGEDEEWENKLDLLLFRNVNEMRWRELEEEFEEERAQEVK
jgi:hypothetical protein